LRTFLCCDPDASEKNSLTTYCAFYIAQMRARRAWTL
jgi:hypothetical protein